MDKETKENIKYIFAVIIVICVVILIVFGLYKIGQRIKRHLDTTISVCREVYYAEIHRLTRIERTRLGYVDELTLQEARMMAGNNVISKSRDCKRVLK